MATCPNCAHPLDAANHGYEVQFAALADAVNISQEGKLNIAGEFDIIWGQEAPVSFLSMYFVAKLKIGAAAGDTIRVGLSILDEDGDLVVPSAELTGPTPTSMLDGIPATFPFIVPIAHAVFKDFGTYYFQVSGGGHPLTTIPLHVLERRRP